MKFGIRCAASGLGCALFISVAQGAPAVKEHPHKGTQGSELIVKFREEATDEDIGHALQIGRLKTKRHLHTRAMEKEGSHGLTLVDTDIPEQALGLLKNHPAIEFAE